MTGKAFAIGVLVVGVLVLLVGGLGIPDGIGGHMPHERGALWGGLIAIAVGAALLLKR